ncbi:MAG TPA: hypothetical protein P5230_01360 [Candidatus Magasanikbacteria bacterium]|nr:hypothetical protein [Candidatus Magasanikbacteria bacterium]
MNAKNIAFIAFFAFVSIVFIACGGEGPDDPVDTDPVDDTVVVDDNEPVDNDVEPTDDASDSEPTDDLTDENPDDDGLIDNEPTDDDTTPLNCEDDENCKEICKNFLDIQGHWNNIDPEDVGSVDITLAVKDAKCEIKMVGQWTLMWYGLDYPLDPCNEGYLLYLSKKGQNLLVERKDTDGSLMETKEFSR